MNRPETKRPTQSIGRALAQLVRRIAATVGSGRRTRRNRLLARLATEDLSQRR